MDTPSAQDLHTRYPFRINPELDPESLREVLQARRRIHIASILEAASARALHRYLLEDVDWSLDLIADSWNRSLSPAQLRNLDAAQKLEAAQLAYASATKDHAHLYYQMHIPIHPIDREGRDRTLLTDFSDFLNSSAFMDFARRLTGIAEISRADARAMRYCAGHFISAHDDSNTATRRAAYVLSLTPDWKAEWGGLLEFLDSNGNVEEAYVPRFNSINVFLVPQWHSVSLVAPFSSASGRLSISGWLYA